MFKRRLDSNLGSSASTCSSGYSCPAVLEMETGDFAIIGTDITVQSAANLPTGCGCGPDERVIRIPRETLVAARQSIPTAI
jgi:hypothetical protein